MAQIPELAWGVIKKYLEATFAEEPEEEVRRKLETEYEVTPFDGGVFLSQGAEFDLFVDEDRRGKWNAEVVLTQFLQEMHRKYGKAVAVIREDNIACLKLAMKFNFEIVGRDEDGDLILENHP